MSKPLGNHWTLVINKYKLLEMIGEGSYGLVMRARNRATREMVAIKYIECSFDHLLKSRVILREVSLLKQLTHMEQNIYTTRLLDIVPNCEGEFKSVSTAKGIFLI